MAYPNPLPSSGNLSINDIVQWMLAAGEITSSTNTSLLTLKSYSHLSNKSGPAKISDFYGYALNPAIGILVVDILKDLPGLNLVAYMSTVGLNYSNVAAYTGNNFIPNPEVAPYDCYILAGDKQASGAIWRFEYNVAKFVNENTSQNTLNFVLRGCATSGGYINISYSLKGANGQSMAMNGSPGTYQPTTSGSGNVSTSNVNSISVPSGATGNYSNSIGSILATFSYNLLSHQITVS